jgi:hypothetical protein
MNVSAKIFRYAAFIYFGADGFAKLRTIVFVGDLMQFLLEKICFTLVTPSGLRASSISSSLQSQRSLQRVMPSDILRDL